MLSDLSFNYSRFIVNQPYTLPIIIPPGCENTVIFSLKTENIYDSKIFMWNPKKVEFMLNILYLWDEINEVFAQAEKSKIYNSDFAEIFCFTMKRKFIQEFDNFIEAIGYGRLVLEVAIEKANNVKVSQMNYLTVYEYLETIEIQDLLISKN